MQLKDLPTPRLSSAWVINLKSVPKSISADKFNLYFSTIGTKTSETFNNKKCEGSKDEPIWKGPKSIYEFSLHEIQEQEVLENLQKLPSTPNLDILGVDSKLLKIVATEIVTQLTKLFIAPYAGFRSSPESWNP